MPLFLFYLCVSISSNSPVKLILFDLHPGSIGRSGTDYVNAER